MAKPPINVPSPGDFYEYMLTERHLEMAGKQLILKNVTTTGKRYQKSNLPTG
jgi:hypothetical protein